MGGLNITYERLWSDKAGGCVHRTTRVSKKSNKRRPRQLTHLHAEDILQLGLQVWRCRRCEGAGRGLDDVGGDSQGGAAPERVQVDVSHDGYLAG